MIVLIDPICRFIVITCLAFSLLERRLFSLEKVVIVLLVLTAYLNGNGIESDTF